jgi:peptide deformylase
MTILPILTYPNPLLKKIAKAVDCVDDHLRQQLDDMYATMIERNGCGLAAPQVGISKRIVVIDFSYKEPEFQPLYMVNPEIVWKSKDETLDEEGCLSIPGCFPLIKRASSVTVQYLDYYGKECTLDAKERLSVCAQHEIDHLNGLIMLDRLSLLKRQIMLKKYQKISG